jgi:hypothetical protein
LEELRDRSDRTLECGRREIDAHIIGNVENHDMPSSIAAWHESPLPRTCCRYAYALQPGSLPLSQTRSRLRRFRQGRLPGTRSACFPSRSHRFLSRGAIRSTRWI